jgi:hypothetical protein
MQLKQQGWKKESLHNKIVPHPTRKSTRHNPSYNHLGRWLHRSNVVNLFSIKKEEEHQRYDGHGHHDAGVQDASPPWPIFLGSSRAPAASGQPQEEMLGQAAVGLGSRWQQRHHRAVEVKWSRGGGAAAEWRCMQKKKRHRGGAVLEEVGDDVRLRR